MSINNKAFVEAIHDLGESRKKTVTATIAVYEKRLIEREREKEGGRFDGQPIYDMIMEQLSSNAQAICSKITSKQECGEKSHTNRDEKNYKRLA